MRQVRRFNRKGLDGLLIVMLTCDPAPSPALLLRAEPGPGTPASLAPVGGDPPRRRHRRGARH